MKLNRSFRSVVSRLHVPIHLFILGFPSERSLFPTLHKSWFNSTVFTATALQPMATSPSSPDLEAASIFFGLFLGLFIFIAMKVTRQSWRIWRRTHCVVNFYVWVIWVEAIVNFVFALTTYLYLRGDILPR
jgi:hypothetical protein